MNIPQGWVEVRPGVYQPPGKWHTKRDVPAESDIHDDIQKFLRAQGGNVFVVHSRMDVPTTTGIGVPDFVVAVKNGFTLWVEVKRPGGKLRPEQAAAAAQLKKLGHIYALVESVDEFISIFNEANE